MVQLQTSEIAEDLAWYLTHSEQVPSSISLGVELGSDGRVAAAGGILIQSLPPGDEEQVEQVIEKLQQMPPVTSLFRQGMMPINILSQIFGGFEFGVQEEVPLTFSCPCNEKQIEGVLRSMGASELQQLVKEQQQVEVVCEYCRNSYLFNREQVRRLIG